MENLKKRYIYKDIEMPKVTQKRSTTLVDPLLKYKKKRILRPIKGLMSKEPRCR